MILRDAFLFLSKQKKLRRWMETSPLARGLTGRFVAGQTLQDVIRVCHKLQAERILATLDHLGENVSTAEESYQSRKVMEEALALIESSNLPATISIKLTQFGLDLSDELCLHNVEQLVSEAKRIGSRVEIDMESSAYTDRTLTLVEDLHQRFGCVRAVLQAYLRRTEGDVRRMCDLKIPVRLCKGAYDEPAAAAFPDKGEVDRNYLKLSRVLLDEGAYPAIASHDPKMINGVLAYVKAKGVAKDRFEFQMLYGIRRDLQHQLVAEGYRMRLYVPYGDAWYPYFMRRLAERPANVLFVARNLLRA
jgi:proline dehydrogenase